MRTRTDDGAPVLLAMFGSGSLTIVGAVVAVAKIDADWADAAAIVLVSGILALLGVAIARQLSDEDP